MAANSYSPDHQMMTHMAPVYNNVLPTFIPVLYAINTICVAIGLCGVILVLVCCRYYRRTPGEINKRRPKI